MKQHFPAADADTCVFTSSCAVPYFCWFLGADVLGWRASFIFSYCDLYMIENISVQVFICPLVLPIGNQ